MTAVIASWVAYLQSLVLADRDLAQHEVDAFFSIFQVVDWPPAAGVWVKNTLNGHRRIWIPDEGLEHSAPENFLFGMRILWADLPIASVLAGSTEAKTFSVTIRCALTCALGPPTDIRLSRSPIRA